MAREFAADEDALAVEVEAALDDVCGQGGDILFQGGIDATQPGSAGTGFATFGLRLDHDLAKDERGNGLDVVI